MFSDYTTWRNRSLRSAGSNIVRDNSSIILSQSELNRIRNNSIVKTEKDILRDREVIQEQYKTLNYVLHCFS